jgi:superfamily I DNA and/or RNA helicase
LHFDTGLHPALTQPIKVLNAARDGFFEYPAEVDAPRGMEFLYSANRLNVATSRAKCICVVVASPRLFEAECVTPRQMQLANALCRYLELATPL